MDHRRRCKRCEYFVRDGPGGADQTELAARGSARREIAAMSGSAHQRLPRRRGIIQDERGLGFGSGTVVGVFRSSPCQLAERMDLARHPYGGRLLSGQQTKRRDIDPGIIAATAKIDRFIEVGGPRQQRGALCSRGGQCSILGDARS